MRPEDKTIIPLRVNPGSPRNEVIECKEGTWRVRIAAPPVKGKANRELIAYLSEILGVGKDSLTIIKGQTSQNKVVSVAGLNRDELNQKLSLQIKA